MSCIHQHRWTLDYLRVIAVGLTLTATVWRQVAFQQAIAQLLTIRPQMHKSRNEVAQSTVTELIAF